MRVSRMPSDDHGADFLRRLSVADAKVLLERTRKEKDEKTKEMQQMIGVRYRDLIESADKIVTMHSAAMNLELKLEELPKKCRGVENSIQEALFPSSDSPPSSSSLQAVDSSRSSDSSQNDLMQSVQQRVLLLTKAPERLWHQLDQGETFEALRILLEAKRVYEMPDIQQNTTMDRFAFLSTQWDIIDKFQARIATYARRFLHSRGRSELFYAQNLRSLLVLDQTLDVDQVFGVFLQSRTTWMQLDDYLQAEKPEEEQQLGETSTFSLAQAEFQLLAILRTLVTTLNHVHGLFTCDSPLLLANERLQEERPDFSKQLSQFVGSHKLFERFAEWFEGVRGPIEQKVVAIINEIPSISTLARIQSKLSSWQARNPLVSHDLWLELCTQVFDHSHRAGVPFSEGSGHDSAKQPICSSVFQMVFGEAFRRKTRDLVQSSFVEAYEDIQSQLVQCMKHNCTKEVAEESGVDNSVQQDTLQVVKYYEAFESVLQKIQDLDETSELQDVLAEEFMRTFFKVVVLLEKEFPIVSKMDKDTMSGMNSAKTRSFLALANICACILMEFPLRQSIFCPQRGEQSVSQGLTVAKARKLFDKHTGEERRDVLPVAALKTIWQELEADGLAVHQHCCLDEELARDASDANNHKTSSQQPEQQLGFFSFLMAAQMRHRVSNRQIFAEVLELLAKAYAEIWARSVLYQRIKPLHEMLRTEPYELSNEQWRTTHEGWSEHEIAAFDDDRDEDHHEPDGDAESEKSENLALVEKVWLPWSESATVSSFLFSCCYALEEAKWLVHTAKLNRMPTPTSDSTGVSPTKTAKSFDFQVLLRAVLVEQLTLVSVEVYEDAVSRLIDAKKHHKSSFLLNFGESCALQFLFDLYFVRATLGFSDFIRFGWGDDMEFDAVGHTSSSSHSHGESLARLKQLFTKMHEFIDPVDWEIYGPQLIENVVLQFRRSRLLFSSLSESNDIHEINGKEMTISTHDARQLLTIPPPVARFSLLPVPTIRRRRSRSSSNSNSEGTSLFNEPLPSEESSHFATPSFKNILSSTAAGSNILSAAASAAKGMSFLSSASSYLREGENRAKASYQG